MKYKSILILTYGRTGSTLLMGILNTIPGVLIRGENMNICFNLFSTYTSLKITKEQHGKRPTDPTDPFYGADELDEKLFFRDAQILLKNQLVGNTKNNIECWGFKEIRYLPYNLGGIENYKLIPYLDFLSKLMPNPFFIFLTRDISKVINSGFWKNHKPEEVVNQIKLFEEQAKKWTENKNNCFWISYEDIVNKAQSLNKLFNLIGATYNEKLIDKVLSKEHSYGGKLENLSHVIERKIDDYNNISARFISNSNIEYINFDAYELKDNLVKIGGVIVLKPNISEKFQLYLEKDRESFKVTWDIPSPIIAKKFPNNPNAQNARFKVLIPPLKEGESAKLYLVNSKGNKEHIATLFHKI